ncbi:MAG: indole-3-glycerol-phosphate synthase [Salinigranum sp.]
MGKLTRAVGRVTGSEPVFLLSEVKSRSPRDGDLLCGRDPAALAREMVEAGADGVSVVTEAEHFGGSDELLATVREAVDVPILAKDFVETRADVDAAHSRGADAILLISGDLDVDRLADLVDYCEDLGIDPLVETHTRAEVEVANGLRARLVGVNNRDIQQLELDDSGVERTERLAPLVRSGARVVSESSLSTREEVRRAVDAGADAVLVGTSILRASDPGEQIRRLRL